MLFPKLLRISPVSLYMVDVVRSRRNTWTGKDQGYLRRHGLKHITKYLIQHERNITSHINTYGPVPAGAYQPLEMHDDRK